LSCRQGWLPHLKKGSKAKINAEPEFALAA